MFVISRCLLGENCKYNGGNNFCQDVVEFYQEHPAVTICPECAGGLGTPREPSEVFACEGDSVRIRSRSGRELTEAFRLGTERCLAEVLSEAECLGEEIEGAILKARSPSCGCGEIYDGSFTGRLVPGDGVFTRKLKAAGVEVRTEENFKDKWR